MKKYDFKKAWKWVQGYEGSYKISNIGTIKSFKQVNSGKLLSPAVNSRGYRSIKLYTDGSYKTKLISRLVGLHFIPNPHNLPQINHKDGNKLNDLKSNLEWCTNSENQLHAYRTGLRDGDTYYTEEDHPQAKISNEEAEEIRRLCQKSDLTQTEIGKKFGLSQAGVSVIKTGRVR